MSRLEAVELTRVHPTRQGDVTALDHVSMSIGEGESLAVIGPSGSGKSTLLSLLLHLDRPTSGRVLLDGEPCSDKASVRRLRRTVQVVPQDPASSLAPRTSILRQVAAPLARLGIEGDHRTMAAEALDRVGLDASFLDRRVGQISGGQAQRVAIARALVSRPRILLADEPVSGLDLPLRQLVLDLLDEQRRELGLGLVLVTHDLGAARQTCTHGHVLDHGRIVESGPVEQLMTSPEHELTRRLVASIPRLPEPTPA